MYLLLTASGLKFFKFGTYFQLLFVLLIHKMLSNNCLTGAELGPMVQRLLRWFLPFMDLQLFGECRKNRSKRKVQCHVGHPNECGFTEHVFSTFPVLSSWNSVI